MKKRIWKLLLIAGGLIYIAAVVIIALALINNQKLIDEWKTAYDFKPEARSRISPSAQNSALKKKIQSYQPRGVYIMIEFG